MADAPLILIGSGGHACVVAETARLAGWQIAGHIAPQGGGDALLGDWLGDDDVLAAHLAKGWVCALGLGFVDAATAARRAALLARIDPAHLATVLHPCATVAPSAQIGAGGFVAAHSVVNTRASLGIGALVNTGAIVEHHTNTGRNVHIATGARLAGGVTLGDDVLAGAGCVVRQGVRIGDGAVIGAGCVVLSDVPAAATWVGNPGRAM